MPHATSITATNAEAATAKHLTESILTLQHTIRNIRDNVANGIAPSVLIPVDSAQDATAGMILLTLEPSTRDIELQLQPLETRLQTCEAKLRHRAQWQPPADPVRSPEYSIIDISDLSSAIALLEDLIKHSNPTSHLTPHASFAKYTWMWDPLWKEFYTHVSSQSSYIYLSRWKLNEQRQVWEHVSMVGPGMLPDEAAELLGSWEDWQWDQFWREWYLDVSEDGETCHVYASRWEVNEGGQWMYVGRIGNDVV